jgi:hypothetical protein
VVLRGGERREGEGERAGAGLESHQEALQVIHMYSGERLLGCLWAGLSSPSSFLFFSFFFLQEACISLFLSWVWRCLNSLYVRLGVT